MFREIRLIVCTWLAGLMLWICPKEHELIMARGMLVIFKPLSKHNGCDCPDIAKAALGEEGE